MNKQQEKIKVQEAINLLETEKRIISHKFQPYDVETREKWQCAYDMAIKALKQEPKLGHWIRGYEIIEQERCTIHDPNCKCSECNRAYDPYIASLFNYCPNCGARMESEEV